MKPLLWFRVYAEAVDDAKLRVLDFGDRWQFIAILCCKAQGLLEGENADLRRRQVAVKLGVDLATLDEISRRLSEVGLIERDTLQPLAWDHRQFKSDHDARNSTERVREWRDKKRNQDVTTVTPPHVTRLQPRTEAEAETETEKDKVLRTSSPLVPKGKLPACPSDEIVKAYHETLPALPQVVALNDKRKGLISARWRQVVSEDSLDREAGLEFFHGYFAKVARSKFLTGNAKPNGDRRPFRADFEWLMMPSNFMKVLEGRYE